MEVRSAAVCYTASVYVHRGSKNRLVRNCEIDIFVKQRLRRKFVCSSNFFLFFYLEQKCISNEKTGHQ